MRLPLVALALLAFTTACGQDAPTCASDCVLIGEPGEQQDVQTTNPSSASNAVTYASCSSTCASDQATATANGNAADFQDLLTCVGNAGSFAPECAPLACGLTAAFGTPKCGTAIAGSGSGSSTATAMGSSSARSAATSSSSGGVTVVTVVDAGAGDASSCVSPVGGSMACGLCGGVWRCATDGGVLALSPCPPYNNALRSLPKGESCQPAQSGPPAACFWCPDGGPGAVFDCDTFEGSNMAPVWAVAPGGAPFTCSP